MALKKIIIVGAGPAGLHCANRLSDRYEVHLFEQEDQEKWLKKHPWADSIDIETLHLLDLPIPKKVEVRFHGEGVKQRNERIGLYEPVKKSHAPRITIDRNAFTQALFERVMHKNVHLHFSSSVIKLFGNQSGTLSKQRIEGIVYEENGQIKQEYAVLW